MRRERSPGFKLFLAAAIGVALIIPLLMVYGLVSDRQHQARTAQDTITQGSGAAQTVSGPVLVIPFTGERTTVEQVDGRSVTRTVEFRDELFLSPQRQDVNTTLIPERKRKAIYETVIYLAEMEGRSRFELPEDLERFGVERDNLLLDEVQIRFGASDMRGMRAAAEVDIADESIDLKPGEGLAASGGSGFHGTLEWTGGEPVEVQWSYTLRGSRAITLVPRGGQTDWAVRSPWPHPGFSGSFLPDEHETDEDGFTAKWSIGNLALGQAMVTNEDMGPPIVQMAGDAPYPMEAAIERGARAGGPSMAATIRLVDPVNLYSQVDRAVKYGFLFIGFTFLAYLMFDIIAGARVAPAEYLLTGAGLVLFFVLLLAFAEVIGFALAYIVAAGAVIGLLTAYSAAVLGSWKRAGVIGGLLVGLYATLYVLLSLEAYSLLIGSLILFIALAAVMYATRGIDWSGIVTRGEEEEIPV